MKCVEGLISDLKVFEKMASTEVLEIMDHNSSSLSSKSDDGIDQPKLTDPKLYKSKLCQFYLQGPCKNGESCTNAHGTSELRTPNAGDNSIPENDNDPDPGNNPVSDLCIYIKIQY